MVSSFRTSSSVPETSPIWIMLTKIGGKTPGNFATSGGHQFAALDLLFDEPDDLLEEFGFGLERERVQGFGHGQAGLDHDPQVLGEEDLLGERDGLVLSSN